MIYKYFGKEVIKNCAWEYKVDLTNDEVDRLYKKLYKNFILEIDCIDNGVNATQEKPAYWIGTGLADRVQRLNSPWNAPDGMYSQHEQFRKAMKICEREFFEILYG